MKIKFKRNKKSSDSDFKTVDEDKKEDTQEDSEQFVGKIKKKKFLQKKEDIPEETVEQKVEKLTYKVERTDEKESTSKVEIKDEKESSSNDKKPSKTSKTKKKKSKKNDKKKPDEFEKIEEKKEKKEPDAKTEPETKGKTEETKVVAAPEIIQEKPKEKETENEEQPMLNPDEIAEIIKLDAADDAKKPEETKEKGKPKILVVDDEHDILFSVGQVLKTSDYEVITVDSGEKCFDLLKRGEMPDLIVLDIMMPVLSGWEVQRRLERNIDWKNIPIIFLTARTTEAAKEMCKRLGADYVSKPFDIDDLKLRIEKILKEKDNK